jgi:hypothetical protein
MAAVGVLLTTSLAYGSYPKLSLQEIAQKADLIFVGTVIRQRSHYNDQRTAIETDVTFADIRIEHQTERARQRGTDRIRLTYLGGRLGKVSFRVSDSPSFETGHRYLVFMTDDDSRPFNPVVGAYQGFFEVIADPMTGQDYLRTTDRRAVVGVEDDGNVRSTSQPIVSVAAGVAAFTASPPSPAATMPDPEPVSPGAAVWPRVERVMATALATPMTIDAFVDHVKNVSLKKKVERPQLAREGGGKFYRMVDGEIVAEPIKETPLHVETIDDKLRRAGLSAPDSSVEASDTQADTEASGDVGIAAAWYEPLMNCGKRKSWPFAMETLEDHATWEWWATYDNPLTYNNYVDLFRPIGPYPGWGWNQANEFIGFPSDAQLRAAYGRTWSGLAVTITVVSGSEWCGEIIESDIFWDRFQNWTDNLYIATAPEYADHYARHIYPVTMHELGHTVGLSRAGALEGNENYSYPYLTYMHGPGSLVEDGRGLHAADAINLRANYGSSTNIADIGVESYYANGWTSSSSWITSPGPDYWSGAPPPLRPGDTFTVNQLTVENMSQFAHSNAHIRLYLSTDQTINSFDRFLGDWYWPTFWGDSYWDGDLTATVPLDMPPGIYWVGLRVSINGHQSDGYTPNNATFVADQLFIACDAPVALSPQSNSVLKGGMDASVALSTEGGCPWKVTSGGYPWLYVTSTGQGTGPTTISYTVDANLTSSPRNATVWAGGVSHTVTQEAGCEASGATPISVWTTVNSALSTADCLSPLYEIWTSNRYSFTGQRPYAKRYSFNAKAGQQIALYLSGSGFNSYVYLLDPSGEILEQDDNGATFGNSRIPAVSGFLTLPTTGVYTIEVTSTAVGATGSFTLELMGTVKLTVSPDPVAGSCKPVSGKVQLSPAAPAGGVILSLHKGSLTAVTLPSTLTIPAGAKSKTFTISTTAVAASQTGTITADWGSSGDAYGTDSLTIRPIEPTSVTLSPPTVNEGSSSTATVTLECAPPADFTLTLTSNKPQWARPASSTLTIPAGSASGTVLVNTFDVSTTSTATIKAAANGKAKSAKLTINPIF